MSARIATGLIVFESTNKRTKTPFESAIIWRDGSVPKSPDETLFLGVESLFLGVGAVCEVLFLANGTGPGGKKPHRAYCVVDGKQGRFEWFGEERPPPGYGTVLGIYTASTMDLGPRTSNVTQGWSPMPRGTKEAHDRLLAQFSLSIPLNITSLQWCLKTIMSLDFTDRFFMPWLPRAFTMGESTPRLEYMEVFAAEIKRDFYQNGQGIVGVYVANTMGPSSEVTGRAGTVYVSYVNRSVNGVRMERVCLSRVPRPPTGY